MLPTTFSRLICCIGFCCLCELPGAFAQMLVSDRIDLRDTSQVHVLHTTRGDILVGKISRIAGTEVDLILRNDAGTATFPFADIRFLGLVGERPDFGVATNAATSDAAPYPQRVQSLFYSATAFGYDPDDRKSEYRNSMLLYNYFDYGITENITLGAGILVPVGLNLRSKVNISINEIAHIGLATNNFLLNTGFEAEYWSHLYLVGTVGRPELFFNITYGSGINWTFADQSQLATLGLSASVSERWRISTEVLFVSDSFNDSYVLPSLLFDRFSRRSKLQFGVAVLPETTVPLFPLLSYSAYF